MNAPDKIDLLRIEPPYAAKVISRRYRLYAADLNGQPAQAQIVNVWLQGVEELQVVLHLAGFVKPLVLTPQQRHDLLQLMQGHTFEQWVGRSILLRPVPLGRGEIIQIAEAAGITQASPRLGQRQSRPPRQPLSNMLSGLSSANSTMNSYVAGLLIFLFLGLLFFVSYLIGNPGALQNFWGS